MRFSLYFSLSLYSIFVIDTQTVFSALLFEQTDSAVHDIFWCFCARINVPLYFLLVKELPMENKYSEQWIISCVLFLYSTPSALKFTILMFIFNIIKWKIMLKLGYIHCSTACSLGFLINGPTTFFQRAKVRQRQPIKQC